MNRTNVSKPHPGFSVLQTCEKKSNEHPQSEQTLLVLEGEVVAEIGEDRSVLRKGDVVIVPRKARIASATTAMKSR